MDRIALTAVFLVFLAQSTVTFGAEVLGHVADPRGQGVDGVRISFKDSRGTIVAATESANGGNYDVQGLAGGNYGVTLDPGKTGHRGTAVALSLDPKQVLCLNWAVSPTAQALALAQQTPAALATSASAAAAACRADPPAMSDALVAAAAGGAVLVAGGVGTGVCAAVGTCFGGEKKKSKRRFGD